MYILCYLVSVSDQLAVLLNKESTTKAEVWIKWLEVQIP